MPALRTGQAPGRRDYFSSKESRTSTRDSTIWVPLSVELLGREAALLPLDFEALSVGGMCQGPKLGKTIYDRGLEEDPAASRPWTARDPPTSKLKRRELERVAEPASSISAVRSAYAR
jgi:hypothetical protein